MYLEGALKHTYHIAYREWDGYVYLVALHNNVYNIWAIPLFGKKLEMAGGYPVIDIEAATYSEEHYSFLAVHKELEESFGISTPGGWLPYNHNPLA